MVENRHGLSRAIPAATKREIRRRSKYGCVCCRVAIIQYEHIDPPFADARSHDPEKICALCGSCHDKVTRGFLAKETVLDEYRRIQETDDITAPYADFDLSANPLRVLMGSCVFEHSDAIITLNGEDVLKFEREAESNVPLLTGKFYGPGGQVLISIDQNEWCIPGEHWDVECIGAEIAIRERSRRICLNIRTNPPNEIEVTQLDLFKDGCTVRIQNGYLTIARTREGEREFSLKVSNFLCKGASSCISINALDPETAKLEEVKMIGGEGVVLVGAGVTLGLGAGQMHIANLNVSVLQ